MKKILLGVLGIAGALLALDACAVRLGGQGWKDITHQVTFNPNFVGIHLFRDNPTTGYISVMGERVGNFTVQAKDSFGTEDRVKIGTYSTPAGEQDLFVSIADFENGLAKTFKGMHVTMGPGPVITTSEHPAPKGSHEVVE